MAYLKKLRSKLLDRQTKEFGRRKQHRALLKDIRKAKKKSVVGKRLPKFKPKAFLKAIEM